MGRKKFSVTYGAEQVTASSVTHKKCGELDITIFNGKFFGFLNPEKLKIDSKVDLVFPIDGGTKYKLKDETEICITKIEPEKMKEKEKS